MSSSSGTLERKLCRPNRASMTSMPLNTKASGSESARSSRRPSIAARMSSRDHAARTSASTSARHVASTVAPVNADRSAAASASPSASSPSAGGESSVTTPSDVGTRGYRIASASFRQYGSSASAASTTPTIRADSATGESADGAASTTSPTVSPPKASAVLAPISASITGPSAPAKAEPDSGLPSTNVSRSDTPSSEWKKPSTTHGAASESSSPSTLTSRGRETG